MIGRVNPRINRKQNFLGLWVTSLYFKILSCSGIHQGSEVLYRNQPIQGRYERGHVVPVNILRYSDESARATFTYTNCVPQIAGFNRGQWKKYEGKIVEYARDYCAPIGGTLYLITGTSQVKFEEILNLQGQITGVDKSVKPMEWFHDNVNIYPALGPKIAIPNSMWTVGCCWKDNYGVVGAFGVMGDNSLNPSMNEFMMSTQTVGYVEKVLRLEHPNLKLELFPGVKGKNCYKEGKNVPLANL